MPALAIDGEIIAQSGAILELLDELYPTPSLFPAEPIARAQARSFGQLIACDLHPINNNRIRKYLAGPMQQPEPTVVEWVRHWSAAALTSLEETLARQGREGGFAFGDKPGFAELHLIPQLYNCRRFGCDLSPYPRLLAIDMACREIEAFKAAAPERMPDYGGADPAWMQ
jgi:maleylpyruvate isomerase